MAVACWLYSDFAAAGGTKRGRLGLVGGTARRRVDGDDRLEVTVDRADWDRAGGQLRHVLRIEWPEGIAEEWRIVRWNAPDASATVDLTALPVLGELATGGPIVTVTAGIASTKIAATLSGTQFVDTYVIPHASAQRLNITRGTIEVDTPVTLTVDGATPLALLRKYAAATAAEIEIERVGENAHVLHLRTAIGASAGTVTVRPGINLLDRGRAVDDTDLNTVVIPLGMADPSSGARATMAATKWKVTAVDATSPGWVTLIDGTTGRGPIATDSQWVGAYLVKPDGTRTQITASRASDSSVYVVSTTGITVGTRMGLVADASGTPQIDVFDTASLTQYGRRAVVLDNPALRGEAQELQDGRFQTNLGAGNWSIRNPTSSPVAASFLKRSEYGLVKNGTLNTSRSAAVGTGTPWSLAGVGANEWIRAMDQITLQGQLVTTTGPAVAAADGSIVLPCAALSQAIPAGTAVTLTRKGPTGTAKTLAVGAYKAATSQISGYNNLYGNLCGLYFEYVGTGTYDALPGGPNVGDYVTLSGSFECRDAASNSYVYSTFRFQIWSLKEYVYAAPTNYQYAQPLGVALYGQWWPANWGTYTGDAMILLAVLPPGQAMYNVSCSAQTVNVTQAREARATTVAVTASVGATSVQLATYSGATPGAYSGTTAFAMAKPVSASMVVTASGTPATSGPSVTINTGTSTIDSCTATEYYNGRVRATCNTFWNVGDSTPKGTALVDFAVIGVTGSTVDLLPLGVDPDTGVTWVVTFPTGTFTMTNTAVLAGNITSGLPFSWTPGNDYAVSAALSLTLFGASDGTVFPAGSRFYVTLPGGGASAADRAAGFGATSFTTDASYTFSGTTTTLAVRAADTSAVTFSAGLFLPGYTQFNPDGAVTTDGVYAAHTGSTVSVAGETFLAAADAQANGAGVASVTPTAANVNAIGAGAPWSLTRPNPFRVSDPLTGYAPRLLYAPGTATSATPGAQSELVTISVPSGSTRSVRAFVDVYMGPGTYPAGTQPVVALLNSAGTVLAQGTVSTSTVSVGTAAWVTITCMATLNASGAVRVAVYGGSSTDASIWHVPLSAMLAITTRSDVPYTDDSHANALALRAVDVHALKRTPIVAVQAAWASLQRWCDVYEGPPLVLGQTIAQPDVGISRRVAMLERDVLDPMNPRVEIGAIPTDLTRRVAILLTDASLQTG